MSIDNESGEKNKERWASPDDKKENLEVEIITEVDLTKAWFFMQQLFEKMLHTAGTQVDKHLVGLVLKHARRVADMAQYIGEQASLDHNLVRFEALCHDCQKIAPLKIGGVNDSSHAILVNSSFSSFMIKDLRKKPAFVEMICRDILDHISTPACVGMKVTKDKPTNSIYGYVLRCANMLDYIGAVGLVYEVELAFRKFHFASKEDKNFFDEIFDAARSKRDLFLKNLLEVYPLFKTLDSKIDDQLYHAVEAVKYLSSMREAHSKKFIEAVELVKPKNMQEFRKVFKIFNDRQLLR